jgi:hypothetical protein
MKIGFKQFILSTAIVAILAPAAMAQASGKSLQQGRYTAVTQRTQPDFDPDPKRLGAFDVRMALGLSAEYNDNIFATETLQDDDTIVRIRPEIDLKSNWTTHLLEAGVSLDQKEYLSNSSESVTDYNTYVGGRIDVQRSFALNGRILAAHVTEQRYEPASSGAPAPAQYDRIGYNAGATFRTDRVQLSGTAGVTEDDFDVTIPGVNRDVSETFFSGRASYVWSPDVSFFIQGRGSEQDYDDPGSLTNPDRDGERSSFEVGASFELQAPFRGEIAVGSISEDKVARPDLDGLSLNAQIEWFPTEITTVTFRGNSSVYDPGLQNSASVLSTSYGARVDHELYRNLILFGDLGIGSYEFEGDVPLSPGPGTRAFDRQDDFTDFTAGLAWKLNKNVRLESDYRLHTQESGGVDRDRDLNQNIFSVGLRFYP